MSTHDILTEPELHQSIPMSEESELSLDSQTDSELPPVARLPCHSPDPWDQSRDQPDLGSHYTYEQPMIILWSVRS